MMTKNAFYEHICNFRNIQNRDLETYLLAVLNLVDQEKLKVPDADLFLKILEKAFTSEPAGFNSDWLKIVTAPDANIMAKKFTNPAISSQIDKCIVSDKSGIHYAIAVIKFQISELHKMKGKQLDNAARYFGIDSETGNRWYNFDPVGNLECGARCILDGSENPDEDFEVSWEDLGNVLEMGRIYE